MKKIIFFPALFVLFLYPLLPAEGGGPQMGQRPLAASRSNLGCLKADIIVISDWSSSIVGFEDFIRDAIYSFVDGLVLSEDGLKIGLVTFSDSAVIEQHLTSNQSKALETIFDLRSKKGSGLTDMQEALEQSILEFSSRREHGCGRQYADKIAIIISDGDPQFKDDVYRLSQEAQLELGMRIFTVLISGPAYVNEDFLKSISSEDSYFKTDYEGLKSLLEQLDLCL